ncbi:MAG: hypothetical protein QOG62_503 [Thermoleophilaceae bacterium]|jgi:glyoxylase-like metal-dependent hydrolase (beta-lactamase superfamily II)|nr:hypothetical protein [Thermoleophilaceae bacterium]
MPDTDEVLPDLDLPGVHRLQVPTPFAVGPVNTYLLEGDPLTLIDSGPNLATCLVALEAGLKDHGYAFEDLELLFVTHQHVDHLGLTRILAERCDAEVVCLDRAAGVIGSWGERAADDDKYAGRVMLRHGIEEPVVVALRSLAAIVRSLGASAPVTRTLEEHELVTMGGRSLEVLHHPGHSPSDTLLFDASDGTLVAGDHLLSKISSNALLTRPLDAEGEEDGPRATPLIDYRRSLLATRALDAHLVLGGHGPEITDHRPLIDARIADQDRRAEKLLDLLRVRPMSAHELATTLWERVAITQAFLTLSEVLGHLDLLIADGAALEDDSGDVIVFEAA